MTLNASGAISLGGSTVGESINLELNKSATATIGMNDSDVRTLAGISSGAIDLNTFHSKSNIPPFFAATTTPGSTGDFANMSVVDVLNSKLSGSTLVLIAANNSGAISTLYLSRLSSSGSHLWSIKLTGGGWGSISNSTPPTQVHEDGSNNIYIATNRFGGNSVQVAKFDSSGNYVWSSKFAFTNGDVPGSESMSTVDSSGNVFFGGHQQSSYRHYCIKVNSDGSLAWAKQLGTYIYYGTNAVGMYADSSGNIYPTLAGYSGYIDVATYKDMMYKLSSNGSIIHAKYTNYSGAYAAGYLRAQYFNSPIYYSNGNITIAVSDSALYDSYTVQFNNNNTVAWQRKITGDVNYGATIFPVANNGFFHTQWGGIISSAGTLTQPGSTFGLGSILYRAGGDKSAYLTQGPYVARYPIDGSFVGYLQLTSASSTAAFTSSGTNYSPTTNSNFTGLSDNVGGVTLSDIAMTLTSNTVGAYTYGPVSTGNANAVPWSITSLDGITNKSAVYTNPGTYSYVVPAGVTSVTVYAVAGGAGGGRGNVPASPGGNSAYYNNYSVTPGNTYTVVVGSGGINSCYANAGQASWFANQVYGVSTTSNSQTPNLALGRPPTNSYGGGGAAGYGNTSVQTGFGGSGSVTGSGPGGYWTRGWGGGGVGIGGAGANGTSGGFAGAAGTGGSGGEGGVFNGGAFGGSGAGGGQVYCPYCSYFAQPPSVRNNNGGNGARGAVRILYPGSTRSFPNTNTGTL